MIHAVHDVDLDVDAGEIVAVVGESGSGKTTLGRCILGLTAPTAGSIVLDGRPFEAGDRTLRRTVQPVFQDSLGSLDPRWTVRRSVREALDAMRIGTAAERDARVSEVLGEVGIGPEVADRRPDTLSGGQRQRVGIAAALAPRARAARRRRAGLRARRVGAGADPQPARRCSREAHGLTVILITHDLSWWSTSPTAWR